MPKRWSLALRTKSDSDAERPGQEPRIATILSHGLAVGGNGNVNGIGKVAYAYASTPWTPLDADRAGRVSVPMVWSPTGAIPAPVPASAPSAPAGAGWSLPNGIAAPTGRRKRPWSALPPLTTTRRVSPNGTAAAATWPRPTRPDGLELPLTGKRQAGQTTRPAKPTRAHTVDVAMFGAGGAVGQPPWSLHSPDCPLNSPQAKAELCQAATEGDLDAVNRMLDSGYAIEAKDAGGWTALHRAVQQGHEGVVQTLLGRAACAGQEGPSGLRPLHVAVMAHDALMARLLLSHGASPEARHGGVTPLHLAVARGAGAVVRVLLEFGADARALVKSTVGRGESAIHMAVSAWHAELIPLLIKNGVSVNVAGLNPDGQTALHIAAAHGDEGAASTLLAAGANIDARYSADGRTALHVAAKSGRLNTIKLLLRHGADLMAGTNTSPTDGGNDRGSGETPLGVAVAYDQQDAAALLLSRMNASLNEGQKASALLSAAAAGNVKLVSYLIDHGFKIEMSLNGITALDRAAQAGQEDVVIYLLNHGADPRTNPPLHLRPSAAWAAENGFLQILGLLNGTIPRNPRAGAPLPVLSSSSSTGDAKAVDKKTKTQAKPQNKDQAKVKSGNGHLPTMNGKSTASTLSPDIPPKVPPKSTSTTKATTTSQSHHHIQKANSSGGRTPKCRVCLDLDFRRGTPRDMTVSHVVFIDSVNASAVRGCAACSMLLRCLQSLGSAHGISAWEAAEAPFELTSFRHGGPLYVTCGSDSMRAASIRAEIYTSANRPTIWPVVGVSRHVPRRWCQERIDLARSFLKECLSTHGGSCECISTNAKLPRRLLDVGSQTRSPHLYLSKRGETGKYIALSHSWGGSSPLTTSTSTLDAHVAGIPLDTLPKTFRDAVLLVRGLGVQYLWIDALCILQDSTSDWHAEAAKMGDVYANSYLTIAAEEAVDCYSGCFPSSTTSLNSSMAVTGPAGRKTHVYFRLTNLLQSDRGEICHRLSDSQDVFDDAFQPSPLSRRAWALQERILSPRTLVLGASEIGWECASCQRCECQVGPAPPLPPNPSNDARLVKPLPHPPHPLLRLSWTSVVEEYTHRHLTNPRDRLPALAGLARTLARYGADEYIVGLWRKQLVTQLMWAPDHRTIAKENLHDLPRRHGRHRRRSESESGRNEAAGKGYYAPSWSWASIMGPVTYEIARGSSDARRCGSRGSDGEARRETSEITIEEATSAHLAIRAPVATALFEEKTKAFAIPRYGSAHGGLLVGKNACADFEPDVVDCLAEAAVGDEVLLVFLGGSGMESEMTHGYGIVVKKEKRRKAANTTTMTTNYHLQEVYRRVGTFRFVGKEQWEAWSAARSERVLRLV